MSTAARQTLVHARPLSGTWRAHGFDWLLDSVEVLRHRVSRELVGSRRSELGQFLTPLSVAKLMAAMAHGSGGTVRILDAGAGVGSLAAALVAELGARPGRPRRLEVTAYELDPAMASGLGSTLAICGEACRAAGVEFAGQALREDFIRMASEAVEGGLLAPPKREFDCAILNPPYRKIRTDSPERRRLQAAGLETTNLYTAFLFLAAHLLVPGGELIAITPRSFCNGPYHRGFRKAFFGMMRLERLHVFETRDTAFGDDEVLQENIILHAVKSNDRMARVHITTNTSPDDPDVAERTVAYSEVVGDAGDDYFVHVVPDEMNAAVARQMARLHGTLADLGISVSTGRVVDFRAKDYLRKDGGRGTAPLLYPGHLINGRVRWPKDDFRKWNALVDCPETASLMVPSGTYVLAKRFSAKEEPRRVVAVVICAGDAVHPRWGFENHLNYFHENGHELPKGLARGLAAYLNTSVVDTYFRQFNGHTQVNATDLWNLPYPTRVELEAIGRRIGDKVLLQDELDALVEECLGMAKADDNIDPMKGKKRIDEALSILEQLGIPNEQQNVRSALTLLALLDLKPRSKWSSAANPLRGITEMMDYFGDHFGKRYAPNTRETVRRFTIHQFVEAGFVLRNPDKPDRPVNSPQAVYQVEVGALEVFRAFGTPEWKSKLSAYLKAMPSLTVRYARERKMERIPVKLPSGGKLTLSPGGQNELIKLVVEEFCPRFTPGGNVLYVGDADEKWACFDQDGLAKLGVTVDSHGKMPDAVISHRKKNWLVLVEAVTSHGPVNPKRRDELKALFKGSTAGLVFVTAFMTRPAMVRYLNEISWESEVWVAESPTHMIHFNGERFLGPYE
jgi:adenine-specific DNA-methyltransferase